MNTVGQIAMLHKCGGGVLRRAGATADKSDRPKCRIRQVVPSKQIDLGKTRQQRKYGTHK